MKSAAVWVQLPLERRSTWDSAPNVKRRVCGRPGLSQCVVKFSKNCSEDDGSLAFVKLGNCVTDELWKLWRQFGLRYHNVQSA